MKELSESKFKFEKITFAQMKELVGIILGSQKRDTLYLQEKYERVATNFIDTTSFLEEVNIISHSDGVLEFERQDYNGSDSQLRSWIIEALFNSSKESMFEFHEYLENFMESAGVYNFRPSVEMNLSTSGLRNFLIQLHLIEYDSSSRMYAINCEWNSSLKSRHKKLSSRSLAALLKNQERLGTEAEVAVINYEKKVLELNPELVSKIKHVAIDDVRAGYDIYSVRPSKYGGCEDRFIEVKAVSATEDFYWSINEVNTAKSLGKKYHLYLLPVLANGKFDFNTLMVISDPYTHLFKQEEVRQLESVSFHVTPNKEYLSKKHLNTFDS